ncbi:uncharacterized protein [Dermacentor albipictus]|uniref:uncharacterized protein isoform X2 n=1 Tax=Dermacentor albipictus TaxID=60249 RepID=UPI0038FD2A88
MTEQRSGGQTPPAFAFIEEVTPGTSREGGEGASGTFDDIPAYIDEYINDALKALKRQTNATDVNDATDSGSTNYAPVVSTASAVHAWPRTSHAVKKNATDSGSTNYAPVVSTASAVHAWPRTSHAGIEKLSSTTKDTASCSDDAWRCQRNAQHRPIADQSYSLDGAYSSGSPSLLQLWPTSSIDQKKPSTSRAVMVEVSASLQYGARNPQTTRVHQSNTQYYTTARTSTIQASGRIRGAQRLDRRVGRAVFLDAALTVQQEGSWREQGMHTTETPEAPVSHFQSTAAAAVANTQGPARATRARRKHRAFWEIMLELLTPPALSHGLRSTTRLAAQLHSPVIHMSLKADAPVARLWCPAAASITHSPVQAVLEWRGHWPFRKISLGMLLEP